MWPSSIATVVVCKPEGDFIGDFGLFSFFLLLFSDFSFFSLVSFFSFFFLQQQR